nr:CDP-diacylglycerol--serine O-phosphatidyltransferase [uncultured Arsenicibacter sp.]
MLSKLIKQLPNTMTCGNLLCGSIAIVMALNGDLVTAAWLMVIAAVLDFGDGFVARLVHASGPFGKELDSLADMVTFGLLPGVLVFKLAQGLDMGMLSYGAFLITVLSAIRLANFNIDTRQADGFIGVPTPANSLMIASFPFMSHYQPELTTYWYNPYVLAAITLFAFMLVAELPLLAFKFKTFSWQANKIKYVFLILSALLLLILRFAALPLIIGLYVVLSMGARTKN